MSCWSTTLQVHQSQVISISLSCVVEVQSKAGEMQSSADGFGPADTEMRILEASIDKISELLAVAFGDAGVDIIAENMKCMGGLNPMVPGQRTACPSPSLPGDVTSEMFGKTPTGTWEALHDPAMAPLRVDVTGFRRSCRWPSLDSATFGISQTSQKCFKRAS